MLLLLLMIQMERACTGGRRPRFAVAATAVAAQQITRCRRRRCVQPRAGAIDRQMMVGLLLLLLAHHQRRYLLRVIRGIRIDAAIDVIVRVRQASLCIQLGGVVVGWVVFK